MRNLLRPINHHHNQPVYYELEVAYYGLTFLPSFRKPTPVMPLASWNVLTLKRDRSSCLNFMKRSWMPSNSELSIFRVRIFLSLVLNPEAEAIFLNISPVSALALPQWGVPRNSTARVDVYTSNITMFFSAEARRRTYELQIRIPLAS